MVVLNIFHVLIAIAMVALVLVQRGAGATAGAAFGSGASGTVFGARGAGTFLTKSTWVLAALFCSISLAMAVMVSRMDVEPESDLGVVSSVPAEEVQPLEVPLEEDLTVTQDNVDADLPPLQAAEEQAGDEAVLQEQATDDLPALDDGAAEPAGISQGEADGGSDSDGS